MLILSFAYHKDQFDAGQDRLCPSKRLESLNGSYAAFDIPVILFNLIIQILILPDSNGFFVCFVGVECSQRCHVGATFINGHTISGSSWCRMALRKKRNAAAASLLTVSRKPMVLPLVCSLVSGL
jgi:hypothetical protein